MILSTIIKKRVELEAISSLKNAKLKGGKTVSYAKELGEKTAQNVLANIAYLATNPDYTVGVEESESWLLTSDIQRELLKQYNRGICCFSSVVNNPLLWSHYGNQHHGICIGYSLNRNPKPEPYKVIYGGNRKISTNLVEKALLKNDPEALKLLDQNILLRKALPWKYELEWRIFGNRGIQDSPLLLEDITFGLRCPTAVMYSITSALESREDIKFYKVYEVSGSFKLKRRVVDTDELNTYFPHTSTSGIEIFSPTETL